MLWQLRVKAKTAGETTTTLAKAAAKMLETMLAKLE